MLDSPGPQDNFLSRHWKALLLLVWVLFCAASILMRWNAIHWLALGDTDDNMRMMQVRALLNGQDWYDLRNYRLNPPEGANIHWSHLVDLPIAGLILILKPLFGIAKGRPLARTLHGDPNSPPSHAYTPYKKVLPKAEGVNATRRAHASLDGPKNPSR